MTAFVEGESASDLDLIRAARDGDGEAVAELYARHHAAAERYARGLTDPTTADDLVAEAFARLLESIRNGGGPEQVFRPYLLRTVHNVYVNHVRRDSRYSWVEDADDLDLPLPVDAVEQRRESTMLAAAFASLPERWQTVLWHTAVEGDDHETVGRLLGIKANAVAALAFRSRDGLRQAYLKAHLGELREEECRPFREDLAPYARGRLRAQRRARLEGHLARCPDCTAGYLELQALGHDLGAVLAPAVLGAGAAAYTAAGGATTAPVGLFAGRALRASLVAGAAAAVVVAIAVGGFAYVARGGLEDPGRPTAATGPGTGPSSDQTTSPPNPSPTPGPFPTRTTSGATSAGATASASTRDPSTRPTHGPVADPTAPTPPPTATPTTTPTTDPTTDPTAPPTPAATPTPTPTPGPAPTAEPTAEPTPTPSGEPTSEPTSEPSSEPSSEPTSEPTPDPGTHEDLAVGSGSHTYYGPHHHVQMAVAALVDPTVLTIDVRRLESFTVHSESSYLPASCASTGTDGETTTLSCEIAEGQGTFAIDVVVSGVLDVSVRVSAAGNTDPDPTNDVVTFHS